MTFQDDIPAALLTVRDFVRYAASRFGAADLVYGHGTFNAVEEAVFLVMESLRLPLGDMAPWWDARLTQEERAKVYGVIRARVETRKPSAYLVNRVYLQDIPFYVDERVIVPRSYIAELMPDGLSGVPGFPLVEDLEEVDSVLDLCTGSGCLAILAAHVFPHARVDAVELSQDAHAVAALNIAQSGLADRVELHRGDLFAPVAGRAYDLIITNPPYVPPGDLEDLPPEYAHEPRMALDGGGADGMDIVRRILEEAPAHLNDGGGLLCEIGQGRAALEAAFPHLPFLWLDTAHSSGEVFWITRAELAAARHKTA